MRALHLEGAGPTRRGAASHTSGRYRGRFAFWPLKDFPAALLEPAKGVH
jgi:hypothetical protein